METGGTAVALSRAAARRARLLPEVFDDCSCVGRKRSPQVRAIIRELNETILAANFLKSGGVACAGPCPEVAYSILRVDPGSTTLHRLHFAISGIHPSCLTRQIYDKFRMTQLRELLDHRMHWKLLIWCVGSVDVKNAFTKCAFLDGHQRILRCRQCTHPKLVNRVERKTKEGLLFDSLIYRVPATLPMVFFWGLRLSVKSSRIAVPYLEVLTLFSLHAGSTPHHRCWEANKALDLSVSGGRIATIWEFWLEGNCISVDPRD